MNSILGFEVSPVPSSVMVAEFAQSYNYNMLYSDVRAGVLTSHGFRISWYVPISAAINAAWLLSDPIQRSFCFRNVVEVESYKRSSFSTWYAVTDSNYVSLCHNWCYGWLPKSS